MALYGPAFAEGHRVLLVSSVAAIIICMLSPLSAALSSVGKMWLGFVLNLAWAGAFLALSAWLIPVHGALGQAAARGHLAVALHRRAHGRLQPLAHARRPGGAVVDLRRAARWGAVALDALRLDDLLAGARTLRLDEVRGHQRSAEKDDD